MSDFAPRPGTPQAKRIHKYAEHLSFEHAGGPVIQGRERSWFMVGDLLVSVEAGNLGGHETPEERAAKENVG